MKKLHLAIATKNIEATVSSGKHSQRSNKPKKLKKPGLVQGMCQASSNKLHLYKSQELTIQATNQSVFSYLMVTIRQATAWTHF